MNTKLHAVTDTDGDLHSGFMTARHVNDYTEQRHCSPACRCTVAAR
jgi:hypothetical protein